MAPTVPVDANVYTFNAPYAVFDTEVSPGFPDTPLGSATTVHVDADQNGAPTWGLLKFSLADFADISSATLSLYTTSSSDGTISAYRILVPWLEAEATWNSFGTNGITLDDVVAASTPSFTITAPAGNTAVEVDVTLDVSAWIAEPADRNQGWVFVSDSTDDWNFAPKDDLGSQNPTLTIVGNLPFVATAAPVASFNWLLTEGKDAEIRSNAPDTPDSRDPTISVDLSDGTNPEGSAARLIVGERAQTNGLMSFDLTGLTQIEEAWLSIFTVSPTSGTVFGNRMKQDWDINATWNQFGGDGISINGTLPDGIEAETVVSWSWEAPAASEIVRVDVTADLKAWVEDGVPNYGWVIYQDSNDGWDFTSFEASVNKPILEIRTGNSPPTMVLGPVLKSTCFF